MYPITSQKNAGAPNRSPAGYDGIIHDGLWDPYGNKHMGSCGETCAREYNFSREDQDNYAADSYRRAAEAWEKAGSTMKWYRSVSPAES